VKDTKAKDVQEFFERVATDWDTMRLSYYDGRVIEKMANVSGADETMTVVDVGTGTGFVAAGIAPRVGRVLAVDNSPAMLGVAEKNIRHPRQVGQPASAYAEGAATIQRLRLLTLILLSGRRKTKPFE
jgi:ubiquinone/menaquinone biosynthesis C-methylase UbiE